MASSEYNTILIAPPPLDNTLTIQVEGLFQSDPLVSDTDENFWSTNHPFTLVHAALLKLEELYRNTEGVKDWTAAVERVTVPLNMDLIEEEMSDISEMEG